MKKTYRAFIAIGVICAIVGALNTENSFILLMLPGLLFLIIGLILVLIQFVRDKKTAAAKAKEDVIKKAEERKKAIAIKQFLKIECEVKGVTFDNEDGTSRQRILSQASRKDEYQTVTLSPYKYKGENAVHILLDGKCVGNVPANLANKVVSILNDVVESWIVIDSFTAKDEDDDGNRHQKKIYTADLYTRYNNPDYDPSIS